MRAKKAFPLLLVPALGVSSAVADAQVSEAAYGSNPHLWAGAEVSNFKPDYGKQRLDGIGFYADYKLAHRIGAEGEIRLLDLNKPGGRTEKTFLAGPIVDAFRYKGVSAYAKVLAGAATVNFGPTVGYGSYFAYAIGGGGEYRIRPRWSIRGGYEHQWLPSAPGFAITNPFPSNGLTPSGYSAGVSYRIF